MVRSGRFLTAALLLVLASYGTASAQGESGAASLIIPPSARANGMGQSFVAIADDATSIWWNPAGMAFGSNAVDLMHSQLVPDLASDVFFEYLGGVYKLGDFVVIGASVQYLTYGEWVVTDEAGYEIGTAKSYEVTPTVGGAIKIRDDLALGMNMKFIYVDLAPEWATVDKQPGTASSVAVDLGGIWRIPDFKIGGFNVQRLNIGACISNFGMKLTFVNETQSAPLPRNLRFGFAYTPVKSEVSEFTVVAEVNRPMVEWERSNTYHAGAEFMYSNLIVVRAGYVQDKDGNIEDPTYGLGFVFNNKVRVDYASIPQAKDLARVHRWSLGFSF